MKRRILEKEDAKIFIEALFYFVKSACQTSDTHFVIASSRLFTTNLNKNDEPVNSTFLASLDIQVYLRETNLINNKIIKRYFEFIRNSFSDILNSILIINLKSFYTIFSNMLVISTKKDKIIKDYDKVKVAFFKDERLYNEVAYNKMQIIYEDKVLYETLLEAIVSFIPRIVRNVGISVDYIYGDKYELLGSFTLSQDTIKSIYNSDTPFDIDLANIVINGVSFNPKLPKWIASSGKKYIVSISRNMILKEFTKCEYVCCSFHISLTGRSSPIYIIRFTSSMYDGCYFSSDCQVIVVKR